jgi:hypothetical protein
VTTLKPLDNFSLKSDFLPRLGYGLFWLALFVASLGAGKNAYAQAQCDQTITANVVVLDNPTVFNRLGAQNPNWITYALERDVVHWDDSDPNDGSNGTPCSQMSCQAGKVQLRPDKRPRPLVVRSVAGSCLTVNFKNLLDPRANPNDAQLNTENPAFEVFDGDPGVNCADPANADNRVCILNNNDQVAGRCAGFHATGTEAVTSVRDMGALVGQNDQSAAITGNAANGGATEDGQGEGVCGKGLAGPGGTETYYLYTPHEGAFVINSYGATIGSEQSGGNLGIGMFGALNVQPKGAKLYRSQVTEEELRLATVGLTDMGQPIIDYETPYPNEEPWISEGKAGLPILNMLTASGELVHSDINAIIAGPCGDGSWECKRGGADAPYPLERVGKNNPTYPNRLEPFREFTSIFHDEQTNTQVFPKWYSDPVLGYTLDGVGDAFMINYGSGGIGSEIIANRLHTGPMHDCTDCAYEEFFLASQTVGDPGQLVNFPANTGIENCSPRNILSPDCWRQFGDDPQNPVNGGNLIGANPPIPGNYALFQEDPSNVHHSYIGDQTKIRNTHAGAFEQHIFHLHNQQWLFNPNDDNANYLDAQEIMPGSGHTYELVHGGSGNRNKTAGDAIFHCHFYPHFAQGMWYHIRIKDVFERGTVLAVSGDVGDPQNPNLDSGFHSNPWDLRSGKPAAGARALPDGELPDGVPIPAIVPLPGKAMPPMPAKVTVAAVDRGDFGVLSGRRPPNGLGQGPDSSQAVILDWDEVSGGDGIFGNGNDKTPGFPFWLAGNTCGEGAAFATETLPDGTARTVATACPEGIVGQRMPTPVLDMLTEEGATALKASDPLFANVTEAQAGGWDGGLPRHSLRGYTSGGLSLDTQNRLDFRKIIKAAQPVYYPETGTPLERVSMAYQAERNHESFANNLSGGPTAGTFVTNGSKPVPGGPFQDPCVDDTGEYLGGQLGYWNDGNGGQTVEGQSPFTGNNPRTYRIANVQIDAVFNKVGHHYSQERIIALWGDVEALINKQRPPEPLVMRFNSFDCGRILHSNLVPAEFELDDFQVRTPTDIIGQHIHLPKWDLTTNDGAANGWNYEDGTLSPLMVQERIHAINAYNALAAAGGEIPLLTILTSPDWLGLDPSQFQPDLVDAIQGHVLNLEGLAPVPTIDTKDPGSNVDPGVTELHAVEHPFFGKGQFVNGHYEYKGARTTIQRILVDPVVNVDKVDRGLGLTFSHDHYGPSTFQQIGLYSTILAEPAGSKWVHNESGEDLWGREITTPDCTVNCTDGGPTTWQAVIKTGEVGGYNDNVGGNDVPAHREFYFEMSDFQHAYNADTFVAAGPDGRPLNAEFGGVKNPDACAEDPTETNCELEKGPNGGKLIPQIHFVNNDTYFDAVRKGGPGSAAVDTKTLGDTWQETINPVLKLEAAVSDIVTAKGACPGNLTGAPSNFDQNVPRPCAEAINLGHSSTWVINYRNEPVGLRVYDPSKRGPDGKSADGQNGAQADGPAGDLALAFQSRNDRAIPELNTRFGNTPYPTGAGAAYCDGNDGDLISCDRGIGDPFTPIMRMYEGDEVKVKIQVGATEEQHQTTIHGIKWLSNGSGFGRSPNSGHRNFQSHGISEQFSLQAPMNPALQQAGQTVDYLYKTDATRPGIWLGTWGIMRTYGKARSDLVKLPNNDISQAVQFVNERDFTGVCPKAAPVRDFDITAVLANKVLPNNLGVTIPTNTQVFDVDGKLIGGDSTGDGFADNAGGALDNTANGGTLVYNRRGTVVPDVLAPDGQTVLNAGGQGPLNDPTAMMYVMTDDLMSMAESEATPGGACFNAKGKNKGKFNPTLAGCADELASAGVDLGGCLTSGGGYDPKLATCQVKLRDDAPVEPLVLRANAGDCINVTLRNKLVGQAKTRDGKKVHYSDGTPVFGPMADGSKPAMYAEGGAAVTEADVVFDLPPDLAGWQDMMWGVTRRVENPGSGTAAEMYFFNNNHVRPASFAGIHPQLVAYDASRDDGVAVGRNQPQLAAPGGTSTARYYAGDLTYVPDGGARKNRRGVKIIATPVEFGGSNLLSADRIKQPQKGLFGALVIEPAGSTYAVDTQVPDGQGSGSDTRPTRAQATITAPEGVYGDSGGTYREALAMGHKIANLRWKDGRAIKNLHQGELGREGAEDSGQAGFNYGMEPSWFRFKLAPDVPFGNAGTPNSFGSIPNPQAMYANVLVAGEPNSYPNGDPATPVFTTTAGTPTRMYVLNGASADRDGTFVLHGHVWQRDPYVCPDDNYYGLPGYCDPYMKVDGAYVLDKDGNKVQSVGSLALGTNPIGKYMGGEEGMGHVYGYWPILFDAGGKHATALGCSETKPCDFLYRDYTPSGNRNGMFGILRVE